MNTTASNSIDVRPVIRIDSNQRDWSDTDFGKSSAFRMVITPAVAADMLLRNEHNRPLSKSLVGYLASQMTKGRWILTGETIAFSIDGRLLNGQHRLNACLESGTPFECWVVTGVHPSAFQAMDRGRKRTASDDLAIIGEKNVALLAATAAMVYLDNNDRLEQFQKGGVATEDIQEAVASSPLLREAVDVVASRYKKILAPTRVLAFCLFRFMEKDRESAIKFFDDVNSGVNLAKGDGALVLRNRIAALAVSKLKMTTIDYLALFIKAWNHRRAGTTVTHLRWITEGKSPENFPQIV